MKKTIYTLLILGFGVITYLNLVAFDTGIVGFTKKNGNDIGCVCHDLRPSPIVSVTVSGPSDVFVNDTVTYSLKFTGGPDIAGGCDISASLGELLISTNDTSLRRQEPFPGSGFELTHRYPKLFTGDTLEFIFRYVAPPTPNVIDTIFASSNSVDNDISSNNDLWNYSEDFLINVLDKPLPVELTSFTSSVSGRNVMLNWTTSSELNNSGFEIERSEFKPQNSNQNLYDWIKVGFSNGNGTVSTAKNYLFTDLGLNTGKYNYRLKQIDFNGNFEYYNLAPEVEIGKPNKFNLSQNYPNPFNPSTKINYELPSDGTVSIKLFDMTGREVAVILNEVKAAGFYSVNFDAGNLPSGTYIYRFSHNQFTDSKKMLLMK
ncbi:MAG: T9SS type A sorting domain-containing protein [Ignavibacteria bacterium]|nr:T9SS type A sorting domain-containing protein [Ignavibacteria bacterium]